MKKWIKFISFLEKAIPVLMFILAIVLVLVFASSCDGNTYEEEIDNNGYIYYEDTAVYFEDVIEEDIIFKDVIEEDILEEKSFIINFKTKS